MFTNSGSASPGLAQRDHRVGSPLRLGGRTIAPGISRAYHPSQPRFGAALSLMINSTGSVTVRSKPLLTVTDLDDAAKKTPAYRAPGH
ncbi:MULTISPECIES: hypothetical protein [unclassified Cryobacterium]|uniref:hypothetical protein n=1 Tax=unclassified Cryobacterium TaxID=2649013 RepID=UPI001F547EA7|nr:MULTISPECIES: hypothetical protein [unclassified Cryobacterium]